jgi:hypothetical protein
MSFPVRAVTFPKIKKRKGIYGEQTPVSRLLSFFCASSDFADVINCAKVHIDRSRGYGWTGVQKSHAPIRKWSRP